MTTSLKIISKKEFLKKHKNKKPVQEEVWDEISDLWNEYRKRPFEIVKNFLVGKKGKTIDLGCGSGRNMIKNRNVEYYGVDISSNQLKAAEKLVNEKEINSILIKSSVDNLDNELFENEMFDYGLFIATLHCLETKKKRENSLKEFYRVLKKGGEGLISVWNSGDSRFEEVRKEKCKDIYMSWKKDGKEYYRFYYLYGKDELIKLIEGVGLKILEINDKETDRFSKKNWIFRVIK